MEFRVHIHSENAQLYMLLKHVLVSEGFVVSPVNGIDDILNAVCEAGTGAVIIDTTAAGVDLSLLKALRPQLGLVLLANRVAAQAGPDGSVADVVVDRPFEPRILIQSLRRLRVEALMAGGGTQTANTALGFADLEMNLVAMKVRRNGHDVPLTALQFRLLRQLLLHPEAVQSRDDLIAACWSQKIEVEPRTVDIHMGHLRRALRRFGPDLIRTVRALGYGLDGGPSAPLAR